MKCPKCQSNNRDRVKFCEDCGAKLELECPACKAKIPLGKKFCGKCGNAIEPHTKLPTSTSERDPLPSTQLKQDTLVSQITALDGERKHATVLFFGPFRIYRHVGEARPGKGEGHHGAYLYRGRQNCGQI